MKNSPNLLTNKLPKLVFVHGAWHGAWCWEENFLPYFRTKGFDCLAFDLPNHGLLKNQQGINKLSIADYVNHLKNVLDQIDQPFILIGHSMGSYIIQRYLEEKVDCVGVILLTSVPGNPIWRLFFKMLKEMPWSMAKLLSQLNLFHLVNSTKKTAKLFFSPSMPIEKVANYAKKLGNESFKVMVFDFLLRKMKPRKNKEIPILVQCAELDEVVSIKENKTTARLQQADFQFIKNIAHDVMLDVNWESSAKSMLIWLQIHFSISSEKAKDTIKKNKFNRPFSDAVNDLITNFADANKTDVSPSNKSDC